MSSDCSIPALERSVSKLRRESAHEHRRHVQGLRLRSEGGTLVLRRRVEALHEPNAQDQNVSTTEGHALRFRAREDIRERDRVRREGVVRESSPMCSFVEAHEVKEDAASADAVLGPVYRMRVESRVRHRAKGCWEARTMDAVFDELRVDVGRVGDVQVAGLEGVRRGSAGTRSVHALLTLCGDTPTPGRKARGG